MREKINYLKEKHTFLLCILIAVVYLTALKCVNWKAVLQIKDNSYIPQLITECIGVILSVAAINFAGQKAIFYKKGKRILKGLVIGGYLLLVCLLQVISNIITIYNNDAFSRILPLSQILIFIAAMLGAGISEEFVFRGAILNLFIERFGRNKKGIYISIILSSIIFGASHISNIFSGVTFQSAFVQAIAAAILGALLAAIYLRSGNIWVVVILHAFVDFSALIMSGFFRISSLAGQINNYSLGNLKGYVIYLVVIIFLLRKKKMLEIIENK